MRDIQEALQQHKQVVLDAGFSEEQMLGVFLYGSQNYGLATENSDVDTKVIIIPTLEDLCLKKAGFVKEYKYNDEKVIVMDLIHYVDNLKKQNINYVEILFTDYSWINSKNQWLWDNLLLMREHIASYDKNKAIQSMGHQALHTLKQDSGNPKKYAMARYLAYFLRTYMEMHTYSEGYVAALKQPPQVIEELMALKTGKKDYTGYDVLALKKELENIIAREFFDDENYKRFLDEKLMEIIVSAVRHLDNL